MGRRSLRSLAKKALLKIVLPRPVVDRGRAYGPVIPLAGYSPWKTDQSFQRVMAAIRDYTLVDEYRCHELWQLVKQVSALPGDVLEVGVWRGGTGALLAAATDKKVVLCDTFAGVVKAGENDTMYRGGEHADTTVATVREVLSRVSADAEILSGIYPDDFPDVVGPFAFVHIDVDVHDSAKGIFEAVWPKMPQGGIVVFDDYGFRWCVGVAQLVDGFRGDSDKLVIHNLNGHAVVVKR